MREHPFTRLWRRVEVRGECLVYPGGKVGGGYAQFGFSEGGRWVTIAAHRYVWRAMFGPVPEGFHVAHGCGEGMCVHPDHLELRTWKTNPRMRGPVPGSLRPRPAKPFDEDGFWGQVDKSGECWLWTGKVNAGGYGVAYCHALGGVVGAYRVSYWLTHGSVEKKMHIDHLCRVRLCVRPEHLEMVTPAENIWRSMPYRRPGPKKEREIPEQCVHGHVLAEVGYWVNKGGWAVCKECARVGRKRWYEAKGRAKYKATYVSRRA